MRATAYDILTWRDGLFGWGASRDEFLSMRGATPDTLRRHSAARLATILEHARRTVPYYREAWAAIPHTSLTAEELSALPIVTKDTINSSKAALVSEVFRQRDLDVDYTSGTTHARTEFYRDHRCSVARFGRQWGILESLGYRPGDLRGLIWGARRDLLEIGPGLNLKARFRRYASAQEVFACNVMSSDDMRDYHSRLSRLQPTVLYGYPSAIEQFARFVQAHNLSAIKVDRIFCTAERLTPSRRAMLQDAFSAEVFDLYCTREHGCIGFECSRHRGFHIDVGSVWVEIVSGGRPAPAGKSGQIVTTDLLNYGMPLIRYSIGDVGALSAEPCDCGCALPLLSRLDGRVADLLYRPDGSIVVAHLFSYAFTDLSAVHRVQFVQEDPTSLDVNVVLKPGAALDFREVLTDRLRAVMGPEVDIRIHSVPDIPRHPSSGKFREVICKVNPADLDPSRLTTALRL